MLKKILAVILAIGVAVSVGAMISTRDLPATHPILQTGNLPPLIPTRAFYADPRSAYDYIASGDGRYVVFRDAGLTGRSWTVRDLSTGDDVASFPSGARFMRWHPTAPRLRFIYDGHDWETDLDKPDRQDWTLTSPLRLSGGWEKNHIATDDEMSVITWGKTNARDIGHMWLVSQDGLTTEKLAEGSTDTLFWAFDTETRPVLRLDAKGPTRTQVLRMTDDGWAPLIDLSNDDIFWPLGYVQPDGRILTRSSRGRDKAALVWFDTATGAEEIVLENPDADIGWSTALSPNGAPDFIRMGSNTFERRALTDQGQLFLDILAEFEQPVALGAVTPSSSGRHVTAAVSPQGKSFIYLLIDLQTGAYSRLGEYHFRRFADHLAQPEMVSFRARDELDIPAVMTRPEGVSGPVPFIVEIHGGPAAHVGLDYEHDTQFLVNRGYGVLSVNFRGSTGYGKAFQAKGFNAFGRAMQDDIADAAQWLIEEGHADPDALVAMGTSYGGFSAALAMTRDPGLFDAAIVEFPMLDAEFQSRFHPGFWESGMHGWWRYFGKIDTPDDLEAMRRYSPVNRVKDLHGPVLVLGGLRDQITAVQQVKDFEARAVSAGKDVTTHYFAEAGHGVFHWRDQLQRARLIEDFLAEHAGGRSGGYEFVENAPAFID